ncbi:MAG: hypothetical protein ACTSQJ_16320 [Promethearchaeota archaeon]
MEMTTPIDYANIVNNLMEYVPDIIAVAIVEVNNEIVYSTDNWDISPDINRISSSWASLKAPFFMVSGVKYTTLQLEIDTLVATSVKGEGHIVGFKDEERKIITYVIPDGDRKAAIVELSRLIRSISNKEPYMDENVSLKSKYQLSSENAGVSAIQVDPQLKSEIEAIIKWIKDPNGLPGYINYYLEEDNKKIIEELAKYYYEFRNIFGV